MEPNNIKTNRRSFLGLLAAGGGCGLGAGVIQSCQQQAPQESQAPQAPQGPLTSIDKIDTGGRNREMVEQASALARDNITKYGNCAQATIAALQDAVDLVPISDEVYRAGSCLHGGATATGNANCGGFTGAGIVIGHLCGRDRANMSDREATNLAGKLMRQVTEQFAGTYGSVLCKDVKEKAGKQCADVVAHASQWAAEAILEQFSENQKG